MPRRKQRRSWGHISESIKGKKYVLRWVENTPEGRKRPCETFYGTYREACARMSELQMTHGSSRPTMTVRDVAMTWYAPWLSRRVADGKTKSGTRREYMMALEDHIIPRWGNTPVDSIPPKEVQEWLLGMTGNQALKSIVVARRLMDFAVQYELVETNKFRMPYEIPSTARKTVKSGKTYSLANANAMFERIRGNMCEASFILACFGSARLGESLGVRRCEVEEDERNGIRVAIVPIRRRIPRQGNEPRPDGDLKTRESMRDIIIPWPYGERLLEISRKGTVEGSEWLAPQHDGRTMSCGQLGWYWRKASGEDHIPFSNLRTSWRTFAQYEWGIDYDTCELLMGHKLPGVTGGHYLKPSLEQLVETFTSELAKVSQKRA